MAVFHFVRFATPECSDIRGKKDHLSERPTVGEIVLSGS